MVGTFVDEQEYSLRKISKKPTNLQFVGSSHRINFKTLIEKRIIVSLEKINHEICINR